MILQEPGRIILITNLDWKEEMLFMGNRKDKQAEILNRLAY